MPLVRGPSAARRFFDSIAPWYNGINARIYRREWLERVRGEIRGPRVLDVGVGTGYTTGYLPQAVGIDLSLHMLGRARYEGHLIRANFERPPLREHVFDTVVFAGSLYYLLDPEMGLRIAARLLRGGGRVVILSPATPLLGPFVRIFSEADYARMFRGAGLASESYERLDWSACLAVGRRP